MSINYAVTKKVDKSKGVVKERYYATTRALQKKPVNSVQIANQLAERSSLQNGDVLSALTQLSDIIAAHLKEGRTVSIDGLGNFIPASPVKRWINRKNVPPTKYGYPAFASKPPRLS